MSKVLLSTVTPVYRGERHLAQLVAELAAVRSRLEEADEPLVLAEAIFVDDASVDGSSEVLEDAKSRYPWVRVIHLSKNFGQHPATIAGILHSSGDWVATLTALTATVSQSTRAINSGTLELDRSTFPAITATMTFTGQNTGTLEISPGGFQKTFTL